MDLPPKKLWIGHELWQALQSILMKFFNQNIYVFPWSHKDMEGIDLKIAYHKLNIDSSTWLKQEWRRPLSAKRYEALWKKVENLLSNWFIREMIYSKWVSNLVLVKISIGDWWVCTNFIDLNKAYLKDSFSLSRIDQMVDITSRHELLSFMDVYYGHN